MTRALQLVPTRKHIALQGAGATLKQMSLLLLFICNAQVASAQQANTAGAASSADNTRQFSISEAIGNFFAWYFIAVRFEPDYCKALGVDMSLFVKAYKSVNRDAYWAATNALRVEYKGARDEDYLFETFAPLRETAVANWNDTATRQKVTPKTLCENVQQNADYFASVEAYSKLHPDKLKVLQEVR